MCIRDRNKLFNYQKDAATGIINKLQTNSGCILADSVGLGKTFTALAVVKYYELRNKSVLVLCPKKLADNWLNYNRNLKTNIFARDRFSYDVLCHTDLSRTSGESFGTPLNRINWGNYDLVVIDESHNFRNNDAYKDKETRYQKLMRKVIQEGVKTKVLMLSATPVNNRFNDLRNQLALAYEGDSESLSKKLRTSKSVEEVFRSAQAVFNTWSKLPPEERTARAILDLLDFDFFELLDSVTIARSRKHIQTFYDTKDIGQFPERRKPLSFHCPLTARSDVLGFNEIFEQLSLLKLAVYAPISYILPSRLKKYEDIYDTKVGGKGTLRQADREKSVQALMTVNLLKRLESSVQSFRLTLQSLRANNEATLAKIAAFNQSGGAATVGDLTEVLEGLDAEDDDLPMPSDEGGEIGGKIKISLADMDLPSWEHELKVDLQVIDTLLASMNKITPQDDAKLQHLKAQLLGKIDNPINPGNRKVLIFTAFADTADYLYANLAPAEESFIGQARVFEESQSEQLLKPEYRKAPSVQSIVDKTYARVEGKGLSELKKKQYLDMHQWMPGDILLKADKMTMAHSLELRVPLLDKELMGVAEQVPTKYLITDENTKYAFRQAAGRHLPKEWYDREKLGFPVPIKKWLREEKFYKYVRSVFERDYVSQFFDQDALLKMIDDNYAGKTDDRRKIWTVYSFLTWYDVYFVHDGEKPDVIAIA